ncbi:hypothetical protein FNV43_RR10995 [Rhamnella rubrinervis]|uniref:Uncharacterized protein n=1 Tax=Rhamnella rubrinervis TaxID=2594499 RepID=A0A8K0H557_9ROSA|nr:hypothetical protein FNV43_RR10995 [Rhamnella rubrinervis]
MAYLKERVKMIFPLFNPKYQLYTPTSVIAVLQGPSKRQAQPIPEGIPLPILEVPYTHIFEGRIRLLYGEPTDLLWASYPTVDIEKMKLAQNCRFLYEGWYKVDNTFRKKNTALNNLTATNKILEKEVQCLKKIMTKVASERDEVHIRATAWPCKKKNVYPKGVEDAFLQARKDMIYRFKAGETSWPTPELSEDEGGDNESSEISFGKDKPEENEKNVEKGPPPSQRGPPPLAKTPSLKQWNCPGPRG